jgi:glucosylceramidase
MSHATVSTGRDTGLSPKLYQWTSRRLLLWVALIVSLCPLFTQAQTVSIWVTAGDKSRLFQKQADATFGTSNNATKITLNEGVQYQTIDGFGHAFTEGSAQVIYGLAAQQQNTLLNDLFNLSTGIGMSVIRISIGASDLGNGVYSYDDVAGTDTNMAQFSLRGMDSIYLVPMLKKVVAINPNIKIMACPWSAPPWMKSNNAFIGGSVQPAYYSAYAKYFVKYIQAMAASGIPIWSITPQNEPEYGGNNPSCTWTSAQETTFINNYLGPAFQAAGITTKIIAYDHNCDDTNYPIYVCNNSSYVIGSAFHLYAGNISAMSAVYNSTRKGVYFTELCTCGSDFAGYLGSHMRDMFMGSLTNWSKTVIEWNLATDPALGPHTNNGGCGVCYGGVMVNSATAYTLYVSYYNVAHFSKVIKTGAVRIATTTTNNNLLNVAAVNTDATRGLVVYNNTGGSSTFDVVWSNKSFPFTLGSNSVASFIWQAPVAVKQRQAPERAIAVSMQNFPEPFTSSTRITVSLANSGEASVVICNAKGAQVATLMRGMQAKGDHTLTWNGTDAANRPVSAGVYIVRMQTKGGSITKRIFKK